MRFSKLELEDSKTACDMEDSMSAAKSGMLCGRDMSGWDGDSGSEVQWQQKVSSKLLAR